MEQPTDVLNRQSGCPFALKKLRHIYMLSLFRCLKAFDVDLTAYKLCLSFFFRHFPFTPTRKAQEEMKMDRFFILLDHYLFIHNVRDLVFIHLSRAGGADSF